MLSRFDPMKTIHAYRVRNTPLLSPPVLLSRPPLVVAEPCCTLPRHPAQLSRGKAAAATQTTCAREEQQHPLGGSIAAERVDVCRWRQHSLWAPEYYGRLVLVAL